MNNLIYRDQAIEAISKLPVKVDDLGYTWMIAGDVLKQIDDIPSAEPEQKKGEWQRRKGSDCWECSQCHAVLENDDLGMHNFYFCYHCGANMMDKSGYMNIEEVHYERSY